MELLVSNLCPLDSILHRTNRRLHRIVFFVHRTDPTWNPSVPSCIDQFLLGTCSIPASIEQMTLVNGTIQVAHCSTQTCIEPFQIGHCSMKTRIEQFPDENCWIPIGICSMIENIRQLREILFSRRARPGTVLAVDASFLPGNVSRRAGDSRSLALPGRFLIASDRFVRTTPRWPELEQRSLEPERLSPVGRTAPERHRPLSLRISVNPPNWCRAPESNGRAV